MKYSQILVGTLAASASAFPAMAGAASDEKRALISPGFDAKAQYVSNKGVHKFIAPDFAAGDQRGPCPGLNAMANHGYLPRNGVGSIVDFISGTNEVFGMGLDLGAFLAVLGAVLDGDLLTWSIGGPTTGNLLGGLLSQPQGISGSHNKYESDVSPTRGDLYKFGNSYKIQMSQFKQLYNMQKDAADPSYTLDILNEFRSQRFDNSVATNPYFFNGPFTGVLVAPAAFEFIYRFMGNKSAEYPDGKLNKQVLKSFFGVTGSDDNLKKNPGMERIPDNWYKRAIADPYGITNLNLDTVAAALKYPKFLTIGGNTGKVNTLTGVAPGDLTGGVLNAETLLQGNNLACFAMQAATQAQPDVLKGIFSNIQPALKLLNQAFSKVSTQLTCPKIEKIDENQFKKFPGWTKVKADGTY